MRRVVVVLAAAAMAAVTAAPGGAQTPPEPERPPLPPLLDPNPELLLEIVPKTPAEKLQESAVQSAHLCEVLRLRDQLVEPSADDPKELLDYGNRYFGILRIFSPTAKFDDPRRRGATMSSPPALTAAIAAERASLYAFHIRVQWAESAFKEKAFDQAEFQRRLNYAFTSLAASPFTEADAELVEAQQRLCPRTD